MRPAVPDTSVWIAFLRQGTAEAFVRRTIRGGSIRFPSVVAHELYVGAATGSDKQDLDRIRYAFAAAELTLNPTFDDWCSAGIMLERYGRLHGRIDPWKHLGDVLVVLSAAQVGGAIVTWNVSDMRRWNRMLPAARRVEVRTPR